jgi:hypothetical protein
MAEAMTELDEIVLVTKMAWALRSIADPRHIEDADTRQDFYLNCVGVDIRDYRHDLATRLDRKAKASEKHRRALEQTKVLA